MPLLAFMAIKQGSKFLGTPCRILKKPKFEMSDMWIGVKTKDLRYSTVFGVQVQDWIFCEWSMSILDAPPLVSSIILKVFAIFWVHLKRLTTLSWCWWLEHKFHILKYRWQHIVIKGRCWYFCVVRRWAISKSCINWLDYFFCHIRFYDLDTIQSTLDPQFQWGIDP